MPGENLIYFGDTARFPYGTRSRDTIIRYSGEIAEYLLSRGVKIIVVACNTVSAVALDSLIETSPVPVLGVISAGARAACKLQNNGIIGVIATRATVNSGSYVKAIAALDPGLSVIQRHATIFVSLTEEGWVNEEITELAARKYIQEMYDEGMRTLILGCTHFPLLKNAINRVYPDIRLVDSGFEVAHELKLVLKEKNLENFSKDGVVELYASDITDTMQRLKEVFFGENGSSIKKKVIESKAL
jgi:glutamate racemase